MKKYSFLLASLFFVYCTSAQVPEWIWSNGLVGTDEERCHTIEMDEEYNLYIAGSYASVGFTIGTTNLTNQGSHDVFLAKYDSAGNHIWAISLGGSGEDEAWDVIPDFQNNVYVTGIFRSSDFAIGSDTILVSTGPGSMFIAKFDTNGGLLWAQASSGTGREWGRALGVDEFDNVYLGGNFIDGNAVIADTTLNNQGSYDMFVTKFTSQGQRLWTHHTGESGIDLLRNLTVSSEYRNVYVIGDFTSNNITFDDTTFFNANTGTKDNFVVKFDEHGHIVWARHIYGNAEEFGSFIAVDWQENIYVTGQFQSNVCYIDNFQLTNSSTSKEVYLAMYDPNGTVNWVTGMFGDDNDLVYSITSDMTDGIYISGWFNSLSFGVGNDTFTSLGGYDSFISKFDYQGNYYWTKQCGGIANDYAECVVADFYGNLYVTGRFSSPTVDFDTITLSNTGDYDAFIGKIVITDTTTMGSFSHENKPVPFYPNPTNDFIYLTRIQWVNIYSISGALIKKIFTDKIDMSAFNNGVYILNIEGENYRIVKR